MSDLNDINELEKDVQHMKDQMYSTRGSAIECVIKVCRKDDRVNVFVHLQTGIVL